MNLRLWTLLVGTAAVGGCSAPEVAWVAQGAGAADWPSSSRAAVTAALDAGVPALEVDVFVAGDRTPVLHATPYLNEDTCRTADGRALSERVWLLQITTEDLLENYRCGAAPDPEHPDAAQVEEPLLTLDAFADLLVDHPEVRVVIDVQQWANVSHPPADGSRGPEGGGERTSTTRSCGHSVHGQPPLVDRGLTAGVPLRSGSAGRTFRRAAPLGWSVSAALSPPPSDSRTRGRPPAPWERPASFFRSPWPKRRRWMPRWRRAWAWPSGPCSPAPSTAPLAAGRSTSC